MRFWLWIVLGLLLCGPALALETRVKTRTPFCAEPQPNCQAAFYLTPADAIRIEGQSTDGKWLRIRHLVSQRLGWVAAGDIRLSTAGKLVSSRERALAQPALALVAHGDALGLIEDGQLVPLQGEIPARPLVGLDSLNRENLRALWFGEQLRLFGVESLENTRFYTELQPALRPHVRFHTLLRLGDGPSSAGWLADEGLLVLMAQHDAAWGNGLLVGLDADYLPVFLIRSMLELQAFLPAELRNGLRGDSLRLVDLSVDGTLTLSAYHSGLRRSVLIRLGVKAAGDWDFRGQFYWPAQIAFKPEAAGVHLRVWQQGEQTFVAIRSDPDKQAYLAYYNGASEPVTVQALNQAIRDGVLFQGRLWTLDDQAVKHWDVVSDPAVDKP